jgi:hypothetical protein
MKKQTEPKRCWRIRGYHSWTEIFDEMVPIGQITESNVREVLRALAAKNLSAHEVIGAYARRGTRLFNGLLDIRQESDDAKRSTNYYCGHNPHFTATVITVS